MEKSVHCCDRVRIYWKASCPQFDLQKKNKKKTGWYVKKYKGTHRKAKAYT